MIYVTTQTRFDLVHRFRRANGERIRRSAEADKKSQAQELHDKLKAENAATAQNRHKPHRSWNDTVLRWAKEDGGKLRWLDPYIAGKDLEMMGRALIDRITDAKLANWRGHASVNRHLALIRAILRKAALAWEWIDKAPAIRLLKEPSRRIRYLIRDEAARLIAKLPPHLADMVVFTLATGLRAANVKGLQWDQIDLARKVAWVHPD